MCFFEELHCKMHLELHRDKLERWEIKKCFIYEELNCKFNF